MLSALPLVLGALLLVKATSASPSIAGESAAICLDRESAMLFAKLAMAINENALEPAKVNDAFIARGTESVIETCKRAGSVPGEADLKAFQAYMTNWSVLLDRKLADIKNAAGAD
jgi:hypothetical protein